MVKRNPMFIVLLCFISLLVAHDGLAQKRIAKSKKSSATLITFKKDMFKKCGDSVVIARHTLTVSSLENDSTVCYFGNGEDNLLWLYPASLYVKLNRNRAVKEIHIVVNDNCRPGCTTANLYNSDDELIAKAENQMSYEDETLSFTVPEDAAKLAVTSYEGIVKNIRIVY